MATGLSTQLTGKIGEHIVTAELARQGIIATPFAGNVPNIDILAFANRFTHAIQVKTINGGSWQFDANKFLDIKTTDTQQIILGKNKDLNRKIICVFVVLGEKLGEESFYIFRLGWLQDYFFKNYKGRRKPKNIKSYHCAIWVKNMKHKNNWKLLHKTFRIESPKKMRQ